MMGFGNSPACEECGEWLTGRQTRYCSRKCQMRAYRQKTAQQPAERACVLCGATFRPRRGKQTFCDFENDADESCATLQTERARQRQELEGERWDKACDHCGENTCWDGVGRPRRFCSARCKQAFYRAAKKS
ncbi:hypothetical protein [Streptomyces sp. NPDC002758]